MPKSIQTTISHEVEEEEEAGDDKYISLYMVCLIPNSRCGVTIFEVKLGRGGQLVGAGGGEEGPFFIGKAVDPLIELFDDCPLGFVPICGSLGSDLYLFPTCRSPFVLPRPIVFHTEKNEFSYIPCRSDAADRTDQSFKVMAVGGKVYLLADGVGDHPYLQSSSPAFEYFDPATRLYQSQSVFLPQFKVTSGSMVTGYVVINSSFIVISVVQGRYVHGEKTEFFYYQVGSEKWKPVRKYLGDAGYPGFEEEAQFVDGFVYSYSSYVTLMVYRVNVSVDPLCLHPPEIVTLTVVNSFPMDWVWEFGCHDCFVHLGEGMFCMVTPFNRFCGAFVQYAYITTFRVSGLGAEILSSILCPLNTDCQSEAILSFCFASVSGKFVTTKKEGPYSWEAGNSRQCTHFQ